MSPTHAPRMERKPHLQWVPVAEMVVCPSAQREARPSWMRYLADNFDPEKFGYPVLSKRGGRYQIVDGQHRIGSLHLMGWDDQQVQCEVYEGLTEADEAALFLWRNNRLNVQAMDSFLVALAAGFEEDTDINRTVLAQGLHVGRKEGALQAVQALRAVYRAGGAVLLGRALRIIRDSFGVEAADSATIRGMGKLCQRYNGQLPDAEVIAVLGRLSRGAHGLRQAADVLRDRYGWPHDVAIAAAVVDAVNKTRPVRTRVLPWIKADTKDHDDE